MLHIYAFPLSSLNPIVFVLLSIAGVLRDCLKLAVVLCFKPITSKRPYYDTSSFSELCLRDKEPTPAS